MASHWSPWRIAVGTAAALALLWVVAVGLGVAPGWVPPGAAGFAVALAAGLVLGVLVAIARNAAVTVYLRYVWTRLNHHEASDLLDRLS